jgi:hypothetical protein
MGPLARAFRPSGLTLGRPLCSFLSSPGDVVPMVPILVRMSPKETPEIYFVYPWEPPPQCT